MSEDDDSWPGTSSEPNNGSWLVDAQYLFSFDGLRAVVGLGRRVDGLRAVVGLGRVDRLRAVVRLGRVKMGAGIRALYRLFAWLSVVRA
jgi:hypothetical protein